jgi:hypothetical protein
MRNALRRLLRFLWSWTERRPDPAILESENALLKRILDRQVGIDSRQQAEAAGWARVGELMEARQMSGTGPWRASPELLRDTDRLLNLATESLKRGDTSLRETTAPGAIGATGDIELALQNVQWRREVNLSWLEFSRWGIQQLILISRLHYVKNPWIQKGINTAAHYVLGRGFEVTSDDKAVADQLKSFFDRNKRVLGQTGLSEMHKALYYDGQVFFACFSDTVDTGEVDVRTIDATEIFDIITSPDDSDEPWLYHRKWSDKKFDVNRGTFAQTYSNEAFYPAMGWDPAESKNPAAAEYVGLKEINNHPIMWNAPVLHMKGGIGVSKWHFDCPKVYAALDWAKAGRELLENCATIRKALSQFAMMITTKGGQQALEGVKAQLGTSVGPTSNLWDKNPPTTQGGIFASGPGTKLEAFNTSGAGGNPSDVKEYRNMVACVLEIPPTWLGDMETSNLSTAQTLDRPTELGFLEKQERWRETLITIAAFALNTSLRAPGGKLREAMNGRLAAGLRIIECRRVRKPNGKWVYEATKPDSKDLEIKCTFPAIREGDQAVNIKAIAEAMTLDNKGGQVVGIDERVGVGLLFEELGVENVHELLDEMYPEKDSGVKDSPDFIPAYEPARTKAPLPAPIGKIEPDPGGAPQDPSGSDPKPVTKKVATG